METLDYTFESPVDSSSLSHVYYDRVTNRLYVKFHNGAFAGYQGASAILVQNLIDSHSVGRFYNQNIRGVLKGISASGPLVRRIEHSLALPVIPITSAPSLQNTGVMRSYTVRGYVLTEETYDATSAEEAVEKFQNDYDSGSIKEVVISFE